MKKIILSIMFVLGIATSISAGEITCRVYGIKDKVVVTVQNPIDEVEDNCVQAHVEISQKQTEDVRIAIEIRSIDLKTVYGTGFAIIGAGNYSTPNNPECIRCYGVSNGTPVAIRIASASCESY